MVLVGADDGVGEGAGGELRRQVEAVLVVTVALADRVGEGIGGCR